MFRSKFAAFALLTAAACFSAAPAARASIIYSDFDNPATQSFDLASTYLSLYTYPGHAIEWAVQFTATASGDVSTVDLLLGYDSTLGTTGSANGGVFTDNSGNPDSLVTGSSFTITSPTASCAQPIYFTSCPSVVSAAVSFSATAGQTYWLALTPTTGSFIEWEARSSPTLATASNPNDGSGWNHTVSGTSQPYFDLESAASPEPDALVLALTGIGAIGLGRLRRR